MIRTILKLESILLFLIAFLVYLQLGGNFLLFFVFLLLPDISMIGYKKDNKTGAAFYNLVHNYAAGIIVFALGLLTGNNLLGYAGLIIFAHVAMDRSLGFGLKSQEGFKSTHLGKLT